LEEFPFLVTVTWEFISLFPFFDILLEETFWVGGSSRLLDLEQFHRLIFFFIFINSFFSLSLDFFVYLLPDYGYVFALLLQPLIGQPPSIHRKIYVRFAELHMVKVDVQLW